MSLRNLQTAYKIYDAIPESIRRTIQPLAAKCRPLLQRSTLSAEQKNFWEKNGYLILPKFFTDEQIDGVTGIVDNLWNSRSPETPSPIMLDFDHGQANQKRWPFHEAPDYARTTIHKVNDLYLEYPHIRAVALEPTLSSTLGNLLDGEPVICNTLYFELGSEQDYHVDTFYMAPPEANKLVASWIALEDIHPNAGPLKFVAGSHHIPEFIFPSTGTTKATYDELPLFYEYIEEEILTRGLTEHTFMANKGDVLIWHANLLHGGSPHLDRSKTRRSLVTHYWRWEDLPGAPVEVDRVGTNWLKRAHQERFG